MRFVPVSSSFQILPPPHPCISLRTDIPARRMSNIDDTNSSEAASKIAAPLGLPAPSDAPSADEPNNVIKLDHLGPMIVNSDGTISRIANWQNMNEIEQERSLRLLAKRNKARIEALKGSQTQ